MVWHILNVFHMHNYAQAASLVSNLIVIISFLWECHMQCDTWLLHSTTILYFTDYSSSLCSSVIQSRDFAICFCAHNYISCCEHAAFAYSLRSSPSYSSPCLSVMTALNKMQTLSMLHLCCSLHAADVSWKMYACSTNVACVQHAYMPTQNTYTRTLSTHHTK